MLRHPRPMDGDRSVIIIGGGVAGLAAGCYARMNGYRSTVVEQHFLPGGLCTSWERKGFTFDGCISYLYGTAPGQPYNRLWQELHALEGRRIISLPEFIRIRDPGGRELVAYADPARLEEHMLSLSPADAGLIRALARGVREVAALDLSILQDTPRELRKSLDWAALGGRMLPFTPATARWGMLSAQGLADRFTDPLLRRAVPHMFGWPEIPVLAGLTMLASMWRGNAGFPEGGYPIHSQIQVSLGVKRDLKAQPVWVVHLRDEPYRFLNDTRDTLVIKHYCFDPTLAPPGKSAVAVTFRMDYRYFERIYGNRLYDAEQLQVAEQAAVELERVWKGIGADVEVTDVATPLSYERYTGNWQGSSCGWLLTTRSMLKMITGLPKTLPGLAGFALAGQWVEPGGGVPMCAGSGRNAVRLMCAAEGRPFRTQTD